MTGASKLFISKYRSSLVDSLGLSVRQKKTCMLEILRLNRTKTLLFPHFSKNNNNKGGLCVTGRRPYIRRTVRLSVRRSVRPAAIPSYTIDARIIKPVCMIPLCI